MRITVHPAHIVRHVSPDAPLPRDSGARRSLRARLAGGPLARAVARADVAAYREIRGAARDAGTVGGAYLLSTSIKLAVGRKRPKVEDLPHLMATPTGLSFPSSHATSSFAAARAFGALLPAGPLYGAAVAMGASRLYLGVHYPSDVAAGAALGAVVGSLGR